MDPFSPNPNQQPQQPVPLDYLDTIAAPQTTQTMNPFILWGLIGGVVLLVIFAVIFLLSAGGPSSSERLQQAIWRMQAIEELTTQSGKTIQSSDLRAANSNVTSILTGAEQEAIELYGANKKFTPAPKTAAITTEFTDLAATLDDARLNARFDRVYSREIGFQLAALRSELTGVSAGSSPALKEFITKTTNNIDPLSKQFTDFNNSQG